MTADPFSTLDGPETPLNSMWRYLRGVDAAADRKVVDIEAMPKATIRIGRERRSASLACAHVLYEKISLL